MSSQPQLDRRVAEALGRRFRDLREVAGLSQEQVANLAGINRNHYQLLETGLSDRAKNTPANPRLSTLVALCDVYGTTVPDLVIEVFGQPANHPTIEVDLPPHA